MERRQVPQRTSYEAFLSGDELDRQDDEEDRRREAERQALAEQSRPPKRDELPHLP